MKTFALLATVAATMAVIACLPTPLEEMRKLPALRYEENRDVNNQYELSYETAEGIKVEERGELRKGVNNTVYLFKSGKSTWTDANGITFVTTWSSDDMGFHADGQHLPERSMPLVHPVQILEDDHRIPDMPNIIYNMKTH